jgi:hypothetical protein
MSDVADLLAAFDSGELLRPSPETSNIVDLAGAVGDIVGASPATASPNRDAVARLIGPCDHLVLVMADGLGMSAVRAMDPDSFIARHVAAELLTVFPSSTPVVLTSLATGAWPAQHGVPAWHVYLEEIDAVSTIIKYVRRSDEKDLSELGMDTQAAYPLPSMMESLEWDTASYLPKSLVGSAFSTYTSGRSPHIGYEKLGDAVGAIEARVTLASTNTVTNLYIPDVDFSSHVAGTASPMAQAAAAGVDRALASLAKALPRGAKIVMTADHGLVDYTADEVYAITPSDPLMGYVEHEPWGTGRTLTFACKPGSEVEFAGQFRERFGEGFYLLTIEELTELELYGPGPMSPVTVRRLGTHMAISRGAWLLDYDYPKVRHEPQEEHEPVSQHGGLTPAEMVVPLVVA